MCPGTQNGDSVQFDRWQQQLKKGTLEFLVLLCLKGDEYYGYSLIQRLRVLANINVAEGTIYPLLNRLEKDGYIESRWQIMEAGPARKYYRITAEGRDMASRMHDAWQSLGLSIAATWGDSSEP
tara:strand:+ start:139377 stop:139748 length:372 start_codon:yes stop_codon:yes gene_type:complete